MIAIGQQHNGNGHVKASPSPNEVAASLTGRDYLSFSQVSTYQACSLKWWYSYHQNYQPETISAALLLGSSVHAAIADHFQTLMAAEKPKLIDELMATYQANWSKEAGEIPILYTKDDNAETAAITARRMLEAFLASPFGTPTGNLLGLEESIRFQLAANIPHMLAKLDLIELVGKELIVSDFKTARSLWSRETAEENADQLLLYGKAVQPMAEELGAKVTLRFVVVTKAKTTKIEAYSIPFDPERVEGTKTAIRQVFKAMRLGVIYPSPSAMNCSGCPHQGKCKSWHREVVG